MVGGNTQAILQRKDANTVNAIGERIPAWVDAIVLTGWLDYSGGDSRYTYNAKLQESTHIFLCDYDPAVERNANDKRMVIDGAVYEVLLIDDPMELHEHMEIFLKFVG